MRPLRTRLWALPQAQAYPYLAGWWHSSFQDLALSKARASSYRPKRCTRAETLLFVAAPSFHGSCWAVKVIKECHFRWCISNHNEPKCEVKRDTTCVYKGICDPQQPWWTHCFTEQIVRILVFDTDTLNARKHVGVPRIKHTSGNEKAEILLAVSASSPYS